MSEKKGPPDPDGATGKDQNRLNHTPNIADVQAQLAPFAPRKGLA